MIKNLVFDLGGILFSQEYEKAIRRFEEIGVKNIRDILQPFAQVGFFGDLESGRISADEYRQRLSELAGRELSTEECVYAWKGYVGDMPRRNLKALRQLRSEGYRLVLLSNTNPFMMMWAMSPEFDGEGHPLSDYFDACYLSYECRLMKPDAEFFRLVLNRENIHPDETIFIDDSRQNTDAAQALGIHTLTAKGNAEWVDELRDMLDKL